MDEYEKRAAFHQWSQLPRREDFSSIAEDDIEGMYQMKVRSKRVNRELQDFRERGLGDPTCHSVTYMDVEEKAKADIKNNDRIV